MDEKIPITIVSNRALIFDLEQVKKLRNLGISGVLSGTLSTAPQQNAFLGLPLQLMIEEVVWLIETGNGYLVMNKWVFDVLQSMLTDADIKDINELVVKETDDEKMDRVKRNEMLLEKLQLTLSQKEAKLAEMTNSGRTIKIFDNFTNYPNYHHVLYDQQKDQQKIIDKFLKSNAKIFDLLQYKIFRYLKSQDFFLAPGLRFGGKFIAYPGDSLRYHAHFIVNSFDYYNDDIGVLNLVTCGRLATGVKKIWLIGGEKNKHGEASSRNQVGDDSIFATLEKSKKEKDVVCFSIEWAGFG